MLKSTLLPGLLAVATLASGTAQAGGDAKAGRVKAQTCVGCHGIEGYNNVYPTYAAPRLAGQHEVYLVSALKAYASGKRNHSTMAAQAMAMTEQDMADIAAYFASFAKSAAAE